MVNTTKLAQYSDRLKEVRSWMEAVAHANAFKGERPWCTLKLPGVSNEQLEEYFDRNTLNDKYEEEYKKQSKGAAPFALLQLESDLIFSMHKCFSIRHRGRLASYRDDCIQKDYRVNGAITLANSKFKKIKEAAESMLGKRVTTTV